MKKCRRHMAVPSERLRLCVIPAKAGIQCGSCGGVQAFWIPAFAGMTRFGDFFTNSQVQTVDPERVKMTVQEILARGPYRLDPADAYTLDLSWIADLIRRLLELLTTPLQHASRPVAMLIIVTLVVILIALVAHILYSFYAAMRVAPSRPVALEKTALPNPDALERQAEQFAANRNYVDATRTLFRAALVRLELKRGGRMMLALTNSEYLRTFRTPWVIENLRVFVELINWKWYRDRTFDQNDYLRCKGAYETLHARLNERT